MRTYVIAELFCTSLLLAGNAALQNYDAIKQDNAALAKALKESQQATVAANTAALDLKEDLRFERALQVELQHKQNQLNHELDQSEALIRRLKIENKELSDWAATDLPVTAQRLRQRPRITGASDYQDWLSSRNRLHAEPDQPSQ